MIVSAMLIVPRALLLDMDGTITRPLLDFPRIKAEMGIGTAPILESLAEMPHESRQRATAILERHEVEAASASSLNDGAGELLELARSHGIGTAIITRNSRSSVRMILSRHGLSFGTLITREDGLFKPSPQPLLRACEGLGVAPSAAWMIGDGQFDIEAGNAAGCATVWISHGRTRSFDARPTRTVGDLIELTALLRECLEQGSRRCGV